MTASYNRFEIPAALKTGDVHAWHLLFLYLVILIAAVIASIKLTRGADTEIRGAFRLIVMQMLMAATILLVTLIVPELRRSIPNLYRAGQYRLSLSDATLFLALMMSWGFGASRFLVSFPMLVWRPDLFSWFGLVEREASRGPTYALLWLTATCVIAPFAEELFFRGFLQNVLRVRWGLWSAIVVSSLLFGAAHLQGAVFAALAGLFLSLVYIRSGSLWPGTLLHGGYNAVISAPALKYYFFVKDKSQVAMISSWVPELVLTVAFIPLLYLFWRRFRPGV